MPLLNYTSKVPASDSIASISRMLARGGARQVMHDYDQAGNITALSFSLELDGQMVGFRLPSDWRPVKQLLDKQLTGNPNARPWMRTEEHARNVAWRVIKDWVEAQLAIIETMMVTTAQVFLPYATTADGRSLYEYIGQHTNLLLGDGKRGQQD